MSLNVANLFYVLKSNRGSSERPQLKSLDKFPKEVQGRLIKADVVKVQGEQALIKLEGGELIRLKTDLKLTEGLRLKLFATDDNIAELVSVNVKQNTSLKDQLQRFAQAVDIRQNLRPKDIIGQQIKLTPAPNNTQTLKAGSTLTGQITSGVEPKTQTQNIQIQQQNYGLQVPPVQDEGSQIKVKVISNTEVEILDVKTPKELTQKQETVTQQQPTTLPRKVKLLTDQLDKIPPYKAVVAKLLPKASITISANNQVVQNTQATTNQQQAIHIQHVKLPSGRLISLEVQGNPLPEGSELVLEANSKGQLQIKDVKIPAPASTSAQASSLPVSTQKRSERQETQLINQETKASAKQISSEAVAPQSKAVAEAVAPQSKAVAEAVIAKQMTAPTQPTTHLTAKPILPTDSNAITTAQKSTEVDAPQIRPAKITETATELAKGITIDATKNIEILEAKVIAKIKPGVYSIELSKGERLTIATDKPLYPNMNLMLKSVAGSNLQLVSLSQPELTAPQNNLLQLSRNLNGLEKVLDQVDAQTSDKIKKSLPSLDRDFAPKILQFTQAVAQQNAEQVFGKEVMNLLRALGLEPQINQDFSNLQQATRLEAEGWKSFIFPYVEDNQSAPKQGGLYWKNGQNNKNSQERETEFLVELELTNLGTVHVDGYMNKREIDINLRMTEKLSDEEKREITKIVHQVSETFNIYAKVQFFDSPELKNDPLEKLINNRLTWDLKI